jgi:hypothetical protein
MTGRTVLSSSCGFARLADVTFCPSYPSPAPGRHGSYLAASCRTLPSWQIFPLPGVDLPAAGAHNYGEI